MAIHYSNTMDFDQAVEYVVNKIHSNNDGFFINTNFGVIPVEASSKFEKPVSIESWTTCTPTDFIINNRARSFKKVIRINYVRNQPKILTKLYAVWGLGYMLMENLGVVYMEDDIADILCYAYAKYHDCSFHTYLIASSYVDAHFNKGLKKNSNSILSLKETLNKYLQIRFNKAAEALLKCTNNVTEVKKRDFNNDFYADVMRLAINYGHLFNYKHSKYDNLVKEIPEWVSIHSFDLIKKIIDDERTM